MSYRHHLAAAVIMVGLNASPAFAMSPLSDLLAGIFNPKPTPTAVPELDADPAVSALALLAGAAVVLHGRRRKTS